VRGAEDAICCRDGERFALLYRALWRFVRGERFIDDLRQGSRSMCRLAA
jgi:hypothetical protein